MNNDIAPSTWDDIVEVGGPLENDSEFGTIKISDTTEYLQPRFGDTDLGEGEYGVAIRPDELAKIVALYRVFFENEPVAHRLCRLVFSQDSLRIDADKVSSFVRYKLSTAPKGLPAVTAQFIVSFDDLIACSAATREHAAMKVSETRIIYYSDDRFVRPLQTLPIGKFRNHCDLIASDSQNYPAVRFDVAKLREFLSYVELTTTEDPFSKSFVELANGVARAVGGSSYEVSNSELGALDIAFRPKFARLLGHALRFLYDGELRKTDNHAVIANQTVQFGFEKIALGHPKLTLADATNIVRFPFGEFRDFIAAALAAFGKDAAFHVSAGTESSVCNFQAFDPKSPTPRTIQWKTQAVFEKSRELPDFSLAAHPISIIADKMPTPANFEIYLHTQCISVEIGTEETPAKYVLPLWAPKP